MFTLKITINERIASIQPGQSEYVTGSVGVDEVLFEFADNFWDDFIKKAVFQNSEGIIREGFLDSENKITVPDDILLTEGYIKIGLYGVDANEKVITSTVVKINNKEGTPVDQGGESEYENIYAQVLAFLQEINSNYVPKTRKIANQPLSDDISSTTLYNILMALATNSDEANATLMNAIKVGSDDTMSTESDNVAKNRIVKAYIDNLISQANSNISNLQTNKEDKNNKVTAISRDSTDVEYPSAKCIYDNIKNSTKILKGSDEPTTSTGIEEEVKVGDLYVCTDNGNMWYVSGIARHSSGMILNVFWRELALKEYVDSLVSTLVPKTRTIANLPLSSNITAGDLMAELVTNLFNPSINQVLQSAINYGSDSTMSDASSNVVKNNVIKAYVDDEVSDKVTTQALEEALEAKQNTLTQADKKTIANIYGQLEEGTVNLINPFTVQNNTIIGSTNGVISHNSAYRFNTYADIKVKPETTYMLQKKVADNFNVYIGYYKQDGTFIRRPYFTTTRKFSFTTPPLTDHIAVCYEYKNSAGTEFYDFSELMLSENDTEQDYKAYYKIANGFDQEFDKNRFSFSAFKKFAVIGDSLSVGYNWDSDTSQSSGRNIPYSWGQALARLYGNECVNMGFSGADTTDWFTNPDYGYVDLVKAGNKCQAYLIGLGVNDSVDAETKEAFKTRYQSIITAVKTVNADAKIFCFSMTLSTNKDIKNEAIKEVVANNTNTYLVDIAGEYIDIFNTQYVRDYMLGNHYTAGGYVNIGMINGWIISEIMDKHADEFWNIFKIPYDASPVLATETYVDEEVKKTYPLAAAEGSIISITDGADNVPIKDLTVEIAPKQAGSGTPSPTNVRALSGWENVKVKRLGKNLIDLTDRVQNTTYLIPTSNVPFDKKYIYTWYASTGYNIPKNNFSYTLENNKLTLTATSISSADNAYGVGFNVEIKPNATYTISCLDDDAKIRPTFYDKNGKYISYASTKTFTTPENAKYMILCCYFSISSSQIGTDITKVFDEIQLEAGETATDYEPYNSQSTEVIINLGRTVYGGRLDVTTGLLTVDRAIKVLNGSETWNVNSTNSSYCRIEAYGTEKPLYADKLQTVPNDTASWQMPESSIKYSTSAGYEGAIIISYPSGITTTEDFKTWLASNNVTIAYEVEPQIYQLTPTEIATLLGNNTIYADCGDSTLVYYADITRALAEKIDDVQINGTSAVVDGVVNLPLASATSAGVGKIGNAYGTGVRTDGTVFVAKATDAQVRDSEGDYRPIVPSLQQASTFYGLAKAAGDSTQSASTNPVGNYTPEAKTKIMNMLGDKYELISTDVLAEDKTIFEKNINNYESVMVVFTLDTALTSTTYITGKFNLQNDATEYTLFSGITTAASKRIGVEFVRKASDLIETTLKRDGTSAMQVFNYVTSGAISKVKVLLSGNVIPTGTTIKIYGKGKV